MAGTSSLAARLVGALLFVSATASVSSAQNGGTPARATDSYLRPGDLIVVHFLRERQLSDSIFVDERGSASFAKLGTIPVANLTLTALLDTLRTRYSEYIRLPEFQIAAFRRVTVLGEVRVPNVYLVDAASTVRDVVARAGGVLETGNRNNVSLIRDGQRVALKGWDREHGSTYELRSGDQVVVGRKNWFVLNAFSFISTSILVTSFVIQLIK
jgi:protein involved in polysaccharide export with SLBB domain